MTSDSGASPPWRRIAAASATLAVVLGALAGWALLRTDRSPRDVGLPPTAPMQLAGQYRTFSVSRDGSFIVYVAKTHEAAMLRYHSLRSGDVRELPGGENVHGTPRLSPDGTRVAFQAGTVLKVVPIAGGPATAVGEALDLQGGEWLDDGTLFLGDRDGRSLRWIDITTGSERAVESAYCLHPQRIDDARVLCGGGAQKWASIIHVDRPLEKSALRVVGGSAADSGVVLGSHFRLVDQHYVVYMSLDGTLMGTRIANLDSLIVGRPVALVPEVRRSAYSGIGQFDIADNGTLTYVPGINADIGQLVKVRRGGGLDTLRVAAAAFQRFAPSPDGGRIAAVVEGRREQELRVYDLAAGTYEAFDAGFFVGAPAWSPDGRSLAYVRSDDTLRERLLVRELDAPGGPRELALLPRGAGNQVSAWLRPELIMMGSAGKEFGTLLVNPTRTPATIDTLALNTFFGSISPDLRWITYTLPGSAGVQLQPWPAMDRRYLVDAVGTEPRWGAANELVYLSHYRDLGGQAAAIMRVRIEPTSANPVRPREAITRDTRFADTPGWSFALTREGEIVYLQSPSENLGHYVRVVPNWVAQMKRTVDGANQPSRR